LDRYPRRPVAAGATDGAVGARAAGINLFGIDNFTGSDVCCAKAPQETATAAATDTETTVADALLGKTVIRQISLDRLGRRRNLPGGEKDAATGNQQYDKNENKSGKVFHERLWRNAPQITRCP